MLCIFNVNMRGIMVICKHLEFDSIEQRYGWHSNLVFLAKVIKFDYFDVD